MTYTVLPIAVETSGYIDGGNLSKLKHVLKRVFPVPDNPSATSTQARFFYRQILTSVSRDLHHALGRTMTWFLEKVRDPAHAQPQPQPPNPAPAGQGPGPAPPQPPEPVGGVLGADEEGV